MSIKTWKKEFYPKPAEKTTVAESLDHSIRKWMGFLPKTLKKHGLTLNDYSLENKDGEEVFCADMFTCALCVHFMEKEKEDCAACPLFKSTHKTCNNGDDVYSRIIDGKSSPKVLINALEKARKFMPKETEKENETAKQKKLEKETEKQKLLDAAKAKLTKEERKALGVSIDPEITTKEELEKEEAEQYDYRR